MDDLVAEFVTETLENLALLDQALVSFERTPSDKEILSNIFRMMHTIKGTCGFLGLPRLEKIAHAGEDVLGKFRDGALTPTPESVTSILKCIDQIRAIAGRLSQEGTEGTDDDSRLIGELKAIIDPSAAKPVADFPVAAELIAEVENTTKAPAVSSGGFPVAAELLAETESASSPTPISAPAAATSLAAAPPSSVVQLAKPDAPRGEAKAEAGKAPAQTIRVSVDVLENLMTLVSEMVLTRNQLLQLIRAADDSVFKDPIERLSRTTSELQEGVMKTRMQPIGNAWSKLPRIVRDLANELGKKINLAMHGEETELDRQVLELIQDPLTHMVRNSADHGLERPEDRRASGKDETGTIRLSAFHEGGHIIVEIVDDGRGINTEKVRTKIIERQLATPEEVAAMDDNTINQFIMRAGFSTAEKVTKVSGRGVGMDVVRSNIEKIGGIIEFRSVFGQGSTFTIKIPLTLAIIPSLIAECVGQRFALPQIAVSEVVRISERSEHPIESLNGAPVLRLRERLLPLVDLGELLGLKQPSAARGDAKGYVVVCRNGSQVLGLIVDAISDAEEIVVKPLSGILGNTKYFSGNTILGDGRVVLILDVNGLASCLSQDAVQAQATEKRNEDIAKAESILLFKTEQEGLKAIPLSRVQRIENLDMASAEVVQGDIVAQYRDRLLPLFSFDGTAGIHRSGRQQILVFGDSERSVGLAIGAIVDIAQDHINIQKPSRMDGFCGSSIVAGRAVDVVDPEFFLKRVAPVQIAQITGVAA